MFSLDRILCIMSLIGGWVDLQEGQLLIDTGEVLTNGEIRLVSKNAKCESFCIQEPSERYLRIPTLSGARGCRLYLARRKHPRELLEQYGITSHMIEQVYPSFIEWSEPLHVQSYDFEKRVLLLSEDIGEELPDYREYAWEDILRWCEDNHLEVVDDYVAEP